MAKYVVHRLVARLSVIVPDGTLVLDSTISTLFPGVGLASFAMLPRALWWLSIVPVLWKSYRP
jgi:hypothetical protein